jgi:hypothetical protein
MELLLLLFLLLLLVQFVSLQMLHQVSRIHIGGFRDLTSVDSRIAYQHIQGFHSSGFREGFHTSEIGEFMHACTSYGVGFWNRFSKSVTLCHSQPSHTRPQLEGGTRDVIHQDGKRQDFKIASCCRHC